MTARTDQIGAGTARGLAGIALLLGVACAVVNGWFFALGLERLEPDAAARAPLLLAGWLMVASEHVAVGLAALLPVAFAGLLVGHGSHKATNIQGKHYENRLHPSHS